MAHDTDPARVAPPPPGPPPPEPVTVTITATIRPGMTDPEVVRRLLDRLVACELIRLRSFREVRSFDVDSEVRSADR